MPADIEKELGVDEPPLQHEHPMSSLFDASKLLNQTHARRLPLLDHDSETGHPVIVSVLTQYRLLKFISINVSPVLQAGSTPDLRSATKKYSPSMGPCGNSRSAHS